MFIKNIKPNHVLAVLAGASAATVTVLSVGGYLLHRTVLKYRLQEQAQQKAMNPVMFELDDDDDFLYDYDEDEDEEYEEYITQLMEELEREDYAR